MSEIRIRNISKLLLAYYSSSLLLELGFFLCFLIHKYVDCAFVVRDELDASHEGLKNLGDADTLLSLIVLHNTAHGALCCAQGSVEHVHKSLVFSLLLFSELKADVEATRLEISTV